jgi:hypothetical protein
MKKSILLIVIFISLLPGCRNDNDNYELPAAVGFTDSRVNSPAEGDIILRGTEMFISWSGFKTPEVRLELWKKKNYYYQLISPVQVNYGSYKWIVPPETPASVSYQVKIVNPDNRDEYIYSEFFSIR